MSGRTLLVAVAVPLGDDEDAEEIATRMSDRLVGLERGHENYEDGIASYAVTALSVRLATIAATRAVRIP